MKPNYGLHLSRKSSTVEKETMQQPVRTITFAVNTSKKGAEETAAYLGGLLQREGVSTRVVAEYPLPTNSLEGQDLCIVIGGDGTLLGVLEAALASGTLVLGVNLGKLGFLATFSKEAVASELPRLIRGHYGIAERTVLSCATSKGESAYGLNDIVLKETEGNGLVGLCVYANGDFVSEYHCDGLIFSTPTGSTAYNLSAGGPIIDPKVLALAMTPICPHGFGNRSVIFDDSTRLTVESNGIPSARVVIDGQPRFSRKEDFPLTIQVTEKKIHLMQHPDHSHFAIVRDKLDWRSASAGGNR